MGSESPLHILLVSFPAQGHINPLLRLAKCLAAKGSSVTLATTQTAGKSMRTATNITDKAPTPISDGSLKFEFFDDGLGPDDDSIRGNLSLYLQQLELVGRQQILKMIKEHADSNRQISCIINNPFLPWVVDVAEEQGIPSALLWIQSSAVFTAYYSYFHNLVTFPSKEDPLADVQLPSTSIVLKHCEIPDFLHPSCTYPFLGTLILEQFKNLNKTFCILVDTYEELEHDFIDYLSKTFLIRPVGPLFKSPQAKSAAIRGDFMKSDDCIEWLNSKPQSSVVYVSFGSIVYLPQEQVDEIAFGLKKSQVSFLWVMKPPPEVTGLQPHVLPYGFLEETGERGRVVQWSPQEEVLAHPSVSCFLTHCGWNSSMEALTSGVPVLTFPAWGDQVTNAKFLVDVFQVGLRLGYGQVENKRVISRDEVEKRLLEVTTGEKAEKLKRSALKWKMAAEAAVAGGGTSDRHLDAFMDDIKRRGSVNGQRA
ncbi:gallate 1-beta-glucosyltransferase 84A24-like [Lotus japonicus]|uniref:gallate 1-beta-glucosyltransferase 84A24-like n=1 Tax=Lotus japonicus TaxID=34305 RepID=UPI00258F223B|nr:gallate 1-beta-glucosyltransferase 84A24-like [Lotus japonicus]